MPAPGRKRRQPQISFWLRLLALTLALVVLVFVGRVAFWIKTSHWDKNIPLTLVVVGPSRMGLFQIDVANNRAELLNLPQNLTVGVAGVGSQYQVKSLWRFGEIEGRAGEIVSSSIAAFSGVWVDGYIYDPNWTGGLPIRWSLLRSAGRKSNLSLFDLVAVVKATTGLRGDQVQQSEISSNLLQKKTSPDGYEIVSVNEQRLALVMRDLFEVELVGADRRTISIANGSGVSGMARLFERMVTSAGGAVVEVKESEMVDGWCTVSYSGSSNGLVGWLNKRVGCRLAAGDEQQSRAEIVVTLAKQWGDRFAR